MANMTKEGYFEIIQVVACTASLHGKHFLYSLTALNILLSITATLGNILILVALRKESSLHPPSKLLFRCLTATDLLVGVFSQPLFVVQLISIAHQQLQLCYTVVSLNDVLGKSLSGVSLCTLTAISVDRLLALLLGLRYKQTVTLRRTRGLVTVIWIVKISVNSLNRFWDYAIISGVLSLVIYSMLGISAFCYMKIFLGLRKHQSEVRENVQQVEPSGRGIPLNIARYKKTVFTALWVQLTVVACYLPYGVVSLISYPYFPSHNLGVRITLTLVLLNSSLNPILYCWRIRGIRRAVKNTIKQLSSFSC